MQEPKRMTPFDPCDCGTCIECIASKKSEVAMTIEERAEKIEFNHMQGVDSLDRDRLVKVFADEITQACDEARRDAIIEFCEGDSCKLAEFEHKAYEKGYSEGFAVAREEAAKIADQFECNSYWIREGIAERIRAMRAKE